MSEAPGRRLRACIIAATAVITSCLIISCSGSIFDTACAGVGFDAMRVSIADASGTPQAFGAHVMLTDGPFIKLYSSVEDPLHVRVGGERDGQTYEVLVTKPFYTDVVVSDVRVPEHGCVTGHETAPVTVEVPVTLTLVANAPPIRSVYLMPRNVLLDRSRTSFAFTPFVDADAGVSRAVSWSVTGDTASVVLDPATGTLTYRCRATSGYVKLVARSLVDATLANAVDVSVQGHPNGSGDPPCG